MTVNFVSSKPAFKAAPQSESQKCNHKVCEHCGGIVPDSFDKEAAPKKKGFLTKVKDGFIGIRKAFIDFGYVAFGALKGAVYGALTAGTVAGGVALKNVIKKAPTKLGMGGKILAGVAGLTVMAGTIINSKLHANEQKSKLDHRWETGHNG